MEFRQSRSGRQTALVLLVSALAIWGFAFWMLGTMLGLRPYDLATMFRGLLDQSITVAQAVPSLLMLALIVGTPLLIWSILLEWNAGYEVTDTELRFRSLGARIAIPWGEIRAVRMNPSGSELAAEVVTDHDLSVQLASPLLRPFYYRALALGRGRLPIYSLIDRREELIAEINRRAGLPSSTS